MGFEKVIDLKDGNENEKIQNMEIGRKSFFERYGIIKNSRDYERNQPQNKPIPENIRGPKPESFEDRGIQSMVSNPTEGTPTVIIDKSEKGSNKIDSISRTTVSRTADIEKNTESSTTDSNINRRPMDDSFKMGEPEYQFFNHVATKVFGLSFNCDDFGHEVIGSMFSKMDGLGPEQQQNTFDEDQNRKVTICDNISLDFGHLIEMEENERKWFDFSKANGHEITNIRLSNEKLCLSSQKRTEDARIEFKDIQINFSQEDYRKWRVICRRGFYCGSHINEHNSTILSSNFNQSIKSECSSTGIETSSLINAPPIKTGLLNNGSDGNHKKEDASNEVIL